MSEWHSSGAEQVAPGVHRIPLTLPDDGLRAVNAYAIADGAGVALIDPGQARPLTRDQLGRGLAEIGYGFPDVTRCLCTHVHRDHYSNAVLLRRELGLPISLGDGERASLAAVRVSRNYGIDPQLEALPSCGAKALLAELDPKSHGGGLPNDVWEEPDEWLADGGVVRLADRNLHVLHTPGHTVGHVTLLDQEAGLLFSGDHVLPRITPSISFEPVPTTLPLAAFLHSLRRTAEQPDAILLAAHGPVTDSAHRRVVELLEHHRLRLELTEAEVRAGAGIVYQVAEGLRWTRRERHLSELDPMNRMLAVMETKAHLDVLADDGVLAKWLDDDLLRYSIRDAN